MTDRELLEWAARAAGIDPHFAGPNTPRAWNPLTDDGDALRLAVALRMLIEPCRTMGGQFVEVHAYPSGRGDCAGIEPLGTDDAAATRRAITRAAAAIGKEQSK